MKNKVLKISLITYASIMAIVVLLNVLTSRQYPWSVYPALVLLFIPLGIYFFNNWNNVKASLSFMGLLFVLVLSLNLINSPDTIWFHHVAFFLIWWPLAALLGKHSKSLAFSVLGSLAIIAFGFYEYETYSPGVTPWHYNIIAPALCWPLANVMIRKTNWRQTAMTCFVLIIASAAVLAISFFVLDLY